MIWQLRATLLACAALACTPDDFGYGDDTPGGPDACDHDGCKTPCPTGTTRGPNGACEATCGPWQASVQMPLPAGLVAAGSAVYAAGTTAADDGRPAQAMVQRADSCAGQLADAILPMSDKGSSASAAGAHAGTLVVAGSSEGKITLAELDLASGAAKGSHVAASLPADAEVSDLSAGPSGAWVVGSSKSAGPWLAHLASGTVCSRSLTGATSANAVAALNDAALFVQEASGKLRLVRVNASDCAAPTCACTPSFSSPELALPGVDTASARDLLVIDASAYLVGHARVGAGEPFGFVAALDVTSGTVGAFVRWDPGSGTDVLHAVTAVGSQLFAGGTSGAALPDDLDTGSAAVAAWKLPLESDAAPVWSDALAARRVRALASDGASVFALAATGTGTAKLWSLAAPASPR